MTRRIACPCGDPVHVCDRFGLEHRTPDGGHACHGHSKRVPHKCCTRYPSPGLRVCVAHGARSPRARAAKARRLAEAEARESLADVVVEPVGSYAAEHLRLTAEVKAWKDHLANVVAQLRDQYRFTDDKGAEHLDARVRLYVDAMADLHRMLVSGAKLGLEERLVRMREGEADLVRVFLVAVLGRLGLGVEEPRVRAAVEACWPILDGAPVPVIEATVSEGSDEQT